MIFESFVFRLLKSYPGIRLNSYSWVSSFHVAVYSTQRLLRGGPFGKTTVTDEDGLVTESFTDNGGKTVLNRYAYRYDYDPRGLLIEKRLPGVDPVYYVYDGKDRAVLSQDGNQRSGNRWSYTLYDSRNRATETGEVVLAGKTATQLRSEAGASRDYLLPAHGQPCNIAFTTATRPPRR